MNKSSVRFNALCLTAWKILILLLFVSSLIPVQGGEESTRGAALVIGPISPKNWSGPLIDDASWNHPPQQPCTPAGPVLSPTYANCNYSVHAIDQDGDPLSYKFDWGDGNYSELGPVDSGTCGAVDHIWSRAGTYLVKARATDCNNSSSPWSSPLVVVVNSPPYKPSIPVGESVALPGENAHFSTSGVDPDQDQVRYIFDWGDGSFSTTKWTASGQEMRGEHSWERAGHYRIAARAVDSRNASSPWSEAATVVINILPNRPEPLSGPGSGYAMAPYVFQTSATDSDGDSLNYSFDWGDSTSDTIDLVASGINASFGHAWISPGTYRIRVIAVDRMGGEWSEERSIAIAANEQPDRPRDLYGLRSGFTGNVYNYFAMTRDPDGDAVKHILDWGDGTTIETDYVPSGSLENASHIWSLPGEYQVRVGSVDEKGAPSNWSGPFLVAISANDPPEQPVVPSGPAAGQCLVSHEYATSARDPNGDPVKYVFDWGDGTTSWTGLDYLSSGEESAVSHEWKGPGVYHIKAAALDDKGSISDWSGVLLVKME